MKQKTLFLLTSIFYLLSSAVVFVIYFDKDDNLKLPNWVSGVCFWSLLLAAIVLQIAFTLSVPKRRKSRTMAFLKIFRNQYSLFTDSIIILSLVINIIIVALKMNVPLLQTSMIFLTLFSAEMHGLLSSNSFEYFINRKTKQIRGKEANEK